MGSIANNYIRSQAGDFSTTASTTETYFSHHEELKKIVLTNFEMQYGLSILNNTDISSFTQYLITVKPYMFFTLDNIRMIVDYINDYPSIRDMIFDITDNSVLDFIGIEGSLVTIIELLVDMIEVNKNVPKLFDERLADSLKFDKNEIQEALEKNSYLIIIYYLCIQKPQILNSIKNINS